MRIDRQKNVVAYVSFLGQCEPGLKLERSLVYQGMTAEVCWSALPIGPITATSPVLFSFFEQGGK